MRGATENTEDTEKPSKVSLCPQCALWLLLFACLSVPAFAVEPWADANLPVKDGLLVWLDATRQTEAFKAHQKELAADDSVETLFDASGHGRDVSQANVEARPRFVSAMEHAAVRFDGKSSHLISARDKTELGNATVFIVASARTNAGGFCAFLSANEAGKNDYSTGFNVDFGPKETPSYGQPDFLNVEGAGFVGAKSLIHEPLAFDQFQVLTIRASEQAVAARVNAKPADARPRTPGKLRLDQINLGARFFSNDPTPPHADGFFDGDIAEVLVFDRALSDAESAQVEAYLQKKHDGASLALVHDKVGGKILKLIEHPPAVQMLVPGFSARKLPVDLTNINNVRYREDGKLVAVAYDGNIYLLADTSGDGLEDKATLWWDNKGRLTSPIGMQLTPPGYPHGKGIFVANKGKVSLLTDTDGDDKLDKETIVADGWPGTFTQVDATGLALGPDGSVYFGIGCANFFDGYQRDSKTGKSAYDLKSSRGTIQRVSPDFKTRESVCTGIRFSVGMAFNPAGDLFSTDQEGATWLPNGNPLDELLHIQPGRHYGFPPRHPVHLPGVIDEPSTFDYSPQHQSTCGIVFNESVNGGPTFGPTHWRGDATIAAESRGKIYRTTLAKTPAGYVAQNQIIASIPMLTIDSCVSPAGDLVVTCHSGPPDWGTGPTGHGILYKISYADRDEPQPVRAYAVSPTEVHFAFDRAIDQSALADLAKKITIDSGAYVGAGDEFEVMRPGYAAVRAQIRSTRAELAVTGVQVTPDHRTLVLRTSAKTQATLGAITIRGLRHAPTSRPGDLPQLDRIDLAYDLSGVAASWVSADGKQTASATLPHLDLAVAKAFSAGCAEQAEFFKHLKAPGKLTLRANLDLHHMLHPRVQPGSTLDYAPEPETVTVTLSNGQKITATPKEDELVPVEIALETGATEPALAVAFTTSEDVRPRPLGVSRFLLPFARLADSRNEEFTNADIPELKGGDWLRGRAIFFGNNAGCSKCHTIREQGNDVAPDLSNLIHRDYESVSRDIHQPSGALNPDYIASNVTLKTGEVIQGIVRTIDKEHFYLRGDAKFDKTPLAMKDVRRISPASISIMPTGLLEGLGAEKSRDLLTFLLTEPLRPAAIERKTPVAPAPRTRAEVESILKGLPPHPATTKPLHVLLVAGPKDHGPDEHDYPLWQKRWSTLLALAENVTVDRADVWPSAAQWAASDVVVFYSANPGFNAQTAKDLDAHLAAGKGLVYLHFAVNGQNDVPALAERIGLAWKSGTSAFRHGEVDLNLPDLAHPITRGFPSQLRFLDESYWSLTGDEKGIHALGTAIEAGAARPLIWTREQGKGRVFVSILGHYTWTFDDPLFRLLILRGIAWSAGDDTYRFDPIATIGARVQ